MIRDRDTVYGLTFRERVKALGIEEVVIAPHSPWQNPYVERVIGTLRRECLDHVIVLGEASQLLPDPTHLRHRAFDSLRETAGKRQLQTRFENLVALGTPPCRQAKPRGRDAPDDDNGTEFWQTTAAWNLGGSPTPDHQHANRLTQRPRRVGRQSR